MGKQCPDFFHGQVLGSLESPYRRARPAMAWAWRAATATELKKQKPQAASRSAWCPGGRTIAMPFKTCRGRRARLGFCPHSCPFHSSLPFLLSSLLATRVPTLGCTSPTASVLLSRGRWSSLLPQDLISGTHYLFSPTALAPREDAPLLKAQLPPGGRQHLWQAVRR